MRNLELLQLWRAFRRCKRLWWAKISKLSTSIKINNKIRWMLLFRHLLWTRPWRLARMVEVVYLCYFKKRQKRLWTHHLQHRSLEDIALTLWRRCNQEWLGILSSSLTGVARRQRKAWWLSHWCRTWLPKVSQNWRLKLTRRQTWIFDFLCYASLSTKYCMPKSSKGSVVKRWGTRIFRIKTSRSIEWALEAVLVR